MSYDRPQPRRINPPVWPTPRSLATTYGISVDVFSSPYLDVSVQAVPRVRLFDSTHATWILSMWVAPFGNLRVNGYLLLTAAYRSLSRPSSAPDAKAFPLRSFQLDLRRRNSLHFIPAFGEDSISAPSFSSFAKNLRIFGELETRDGSLSLQRPFTEIAILMNYAGFTKKFFEIVIVTLHPFGCCSTIKTYASRCFQRLPLCCLTSLSSHCSVFKVQSPASFEARSQNPNPFGF